MDLLENVLGFKLANAFHSSIDYHLFDSPIFSVVVLQLTRVDVPHSVTSLSHGKPSGTPTGLAVLENRPAQEAL